MSLDLDKLEKILMKAIALIGLHIIAFVYDGQWIYVVAGIDCTLFGITIRNGITEKKSEG